MSIKELFQRYTSQLSKTRIFRRSENKNNMFKDIPEHVAIIMDGNGRWARKRGLPRSAGHREGAAALRRVVRYCNQSGIRYLTVYAFSTENWKRPVEEVSFLMSLLLDYLKNAEKELGGNDIRIRVIGKEENLSKEILEEIMRVEAVTAKNSGMVLCIALNYGGRDDILQAVREIGRLCAADRLLPSSVDEELFSSFLYTKDIPDPDILIRPSGEMRHSNFLLWQCAFTEFWYTDVLWPDFGKRHLMEAIKSYSERNRRFGGL